MLGILVDCGILNVGCWKVSLSPVVKSEDEVNDCVESFIKSMKSYLSISITLAVMHRENSRKHNPRPSSHRRKLGNHLPQLNPLVRARLQHLRNNSNGSHVEERARCKRQQ